MRERLDRFCNSFAYKYQSHTSQAGETGALCQVWVPQDTPGGVRLTTQGFPFAILGSADALTLYRYYSGKYQPLCDGPGLNAACPITRVYANLQPGSCSSSGSKTDDAAGYFDRQAAARLANVHSSLLLAVHDAQQQQQHLPCCVLELVQQEKDVDFTTAVGILQEVAQECDFWIPELGSAAASSKVRAVVTVGGSFRRAGASGAWEYAGGAQKVVVLPRAAAFEELLGLLSSRADAAGSGFGQVQVKYALPGMAGSLIDLACSEDLDNISLLAKHQQQQQQQQVLQPWLNVHSVQAAAPEGDSAAGFGEDSSEQFATCFEMTDALQADPEVAAVLAAMAAERAAGKQVVGEVQSSSRDQEQQQQQQQRKVDTELKQLVKQLQGQVELIMPHELRVVRYVGGGAFGEVYLCKWHGTDVAVKCLSPSLLASSSSSSSSSRRAAAPAAELLQEAATMASMRHPHVMSAIGVVLPPSDIVSLTGVVIGGRDDAAAADSAAAGPGGIRPGDAVQGPAVVCEYLSAGSLQSCISSGAEWLKSGMAKVKVLLDTARGLSYLHSKHVVHFDLKSANLLFTIRDRTPTVKVADFGLSKRRYQTYVTGVDSMRGTLPWIAPEIIKSPGNVTEAADVYSFGVIMWELWAMQEPFAGVHIHALLHQLTTHGGLSLAVPGSAEWGDAAAPPEPALGWSALMQRCWRAEPAARPSSRELVGELEEMMAAVRRVKK
ncbi:hypothetical protein OEZ85_008857 [Tetradesmus obliquus]|uniref:Protein kinase domain-containing protein n=1 Tax=Tetradesmus obliquus TaxID=3088 RepID=A0ABY8TM94_TETOB|nr:hypothetical protein OEZ85_008857 [Tetradesmus obliquus]